MTLVSILGDFHSSILPIFYNFKDELTTHILVYDDSKCDIKKANKILKAQEDFKKEYNLNYELKTIIVDEDNYNSLLGAVAKIKRYSNNYKDIYLNITDGLTSISLVLFQELLSVGAKALSYDRYENSYNIHTTSQMLHKKIENSMNIREHLILKGYTIKEIGSNNSAYKEAIYAICKDIKRFKEFTTLIYKKDCKDIAGYNDIKEQLNKLGKCEDKSYIQGSIFEEYIFNLIKDNFDFDDIALNVKVEFEDGVENELDILMIKDNHLHTIECKLVNFLDGERYVYKSELVKDYLDDDGRAMIVSIGGENRQYTKRGRVKTQFSLGDKARAKLGDIYIFQSKDFKKDRFLQTIKAWFIDSYN